MLFCLMFAIEPDSFNPYSCSVLTEGNNHLYMLYYVAFYNVSFKYRILQNTSMRGLFEQRTIEMGLV